MSTFLTTTGKKCERKGGVQTNTVKGEALTEGIGVKVLKLESTCRVIVWRRDFVRCL